MANKPIVPPAIPPTAACDNPSRFNSDSDGMGAVVCDEGGADVAVLKDLVIALGSVTVVGGFV
jgi:hypothetical protein